MANAENSMPSNGDNQPKRMTVVEDKVEYKPGMVFHEANISRIIPEDDYVQGIENVPYQSDKAEQNHSEALDKWALIRSKTKKIINSDSLYEKLADWLRESALPEIFIK